MYFAGVLLSLVLLQGGDKLQITDLKVGTGAAVKEGDFLTMNYTGKLTNGKVFDSSLNQGREPFKFMIGAHQVIKGWDQGILGMKIGGKRHLIIPAALAYGSQSPGADIPPNSTLAFDVELLGIDRVKSTTTKAGSGTSVTFGDSVQIHYLGKFKDGKKFDSSYDRKEPITLTIGDPRMIQGFSQGILGMRVGEKRTVTIPPVLGYGAKGSSGRIPPNTTLIFDLELVKVMK